MSTDSGSDMQFRVERVAASLRYSVIDSIRNAIALRRFKPGQRLLERELCELTGVSRTLVREALRQLESEGLVVIQPHRGPFVRELSPEQAMGVYDVRKELEGLAAALFAARATDAQREALKRSFAKLKASLLSTSQTDRLHTKNEFYDRLIAGAGNDALGDALRMLNSRVTVLRATSLQADGRSQQSLEELAVLMDALETRDPAVARAAAEAHVANAAAAAVARLTEEMEG